jgi:3-hydroxybutyryl-CoA dehydrogenase
MDDTLLVLGAGTMGAQIAQQAALQGVPVQLVDVSQEQLHRAVAENFGHLERSVAKGRITNAEATAALDRVVTTTHLADAASSASWAIEAIVEDLRAKRQVFAELDTHLPPDAGIASNSSNIVVSRLATATKRPQLCCNMHFFHPVLVMDLCEIAPGPDTAEETIAQAIRWAERMRRRPILLRHEVDGFLVNRVLGAATREAFTLLDAGVASFMDIDAAVAAGLRWPLGPFQLCDFNGIDTVLGVRRDRLAREHHEGDAATVRVLEQLVEAGRLGRKSGRGFYDYATTPPTPIALPNKR